MTFSLVKSAYEDAICSSSEFVALLATGASFTIFVIVLLIVVVGSWLLLVIMGIGVIGSSFGEDVVKVTSGSVVK